MKLVPVTLCGMTAVGMLGVLIAWSGVYNVAASTGHWPLTAWFLHFAMQNSVETHARGKAPKLEDPALVERAAGHFDTGCAPCHGAPGQPGDMILQAMVPPPPDLSPLIGKWTANELFWIVKNGIKYAGMPAWLAQDRDDEVWAMTAFLLALPGLSADQYQRLAQGSRAASRDRAADFQPLDVLPARSEGVLIQSCERCHGEDGAGRSGGAFPRLDIQSAEYLARALSEYASGMRPSGIMQPIASELESGEIRLLAEHFAAQDGGPQTGESDAAIIAQGLRLATEGNDVRDIGACSACHGLEKGPSNLLFPALAGQFAGVTYAQLELWRAKARGEGPFARIMQAAAASLSPEDMEAAAQFYASLTPGTPADRLEAERQ